MRRRPVVFEILQPLARFGDRWNVTRGDPPEGQNRPVDLLEPLLSAAKRAYVIASVDELLRRFERFPDRHVDRHEIVAVVRTDGRRVSVLRLESPHETRRPISERVDRIELRAEAFHDWVVDRRPKSPNVHLRQMKLLHAYLSGAVVLVGLPLGWIELRHPSFKPYEQFESKPGKVANSTLKVHFLGVTTLLLDDGKNRILIDGFLSRPSKLSLLGRIEPDTSRIRWALDSTGLRKNTARGDSIDAILVAHAHYDHAFDAAEVAVMTKARLLGGNSVANIARGDPRFDMNRFQLIGNSSVDTVGDFRIKVFASPHSPDAHFQGTIDEPLRPPKWLCAYKTGESLSFLIEHGSRRILIHPSANVTPGFLKGEKADVVFLGVSQLGLQDSVFRQTYWREVVDSSGAKTIIPIHWDDFTISLDKPLEPMPRIMDDLPKGMAFVLEKAKAKGVAVQFLPLFKPVDVFERAQ